METWEPWFILIPADAYSVSRQHAMNLMRPGQYIHHRRGATCSLDNGRGGGGANHCSHAMLNCLIKPGAAPHQTNQFCLCWEYRRELVHIFVLHLLKFSINPHIIVVFKIYNHFYYATITSCQMSSPCLYYPCRVLCLYCGTNGINSSCISFKTIVFSASRYSCNRCTSPFSGKIQLIKLNWSNSETMQPR